VYFYGRTHKKYMSNNKNAVTIQKPVIGFTSGDLNGVGTELIIKVLSDNRLLEFCTPVIFSNNKLINFYRKTLPDVNFHFTIAKSSNDLNHKQVNLFNCWDDEVEITPGVLSDDAGRYAVGSLVMATEALKAGKIDGLVTAPIHKKNVQSEHFAYTGHTPFLKDAFGVRDVAMMLVGDNMKVAVLTEHIPVKDIAAHITIEAFAYLRLWAYKTQNSSAWPKPACRG
jgi:4-hydroxythreonine-4-phosphate dehydrogenase